MKAPADATLGVARTFKVGRYTVTLTLPTVAPGTVVMMSCEWEPNMPTRLSKAEFRQYEKARDAAIAAMADELGVIGTVLTVNVK